MEWAWLRSSLEKPLVRRVNRRRDIRNVGVLGYFKKNPPCQVRWHGGFSVLPDFKEAHDRIATIA